MARAIEVEEEVGDLWAEDDDWARCNSCDGSGRLPGGFAAAGFTEVCTGCNGIGMPVDGFWSDSMAAALDAGLGGV